MDVAATVTFPNNKVKWVGNSGQKFSVCKLEEGCAVQDLRSAQAIIHLQAVNYCLRVHHALTDRDS